jgi:hypothetical protein
MFKFRVRDPGWWFWLATTIALYVGPFVDPRGYTAALLITVVHLSHYLIRDRGLTFPVQVRAAVLGFMLLGLFEPLLFLYWMLAFGGTVQVLFGYCIMARVVSLLPWNLEEPFGLGLVKKTFLTPPTIGSVRQGFAAEPTT